MSNEELAPEYLEPVPAGIGLTRRIAYWDDFFGQANHEQCEQLAGEALDELNELWEITGPMAKQCIISGYGMWSQLDMGSDEDGEEGSVEVLSKPAQFIAKKGDFTGMEGVSVGFGLADIDNEGRDSLCYQFGLGCYAVMDHQTLYREMTSYLFVKVEDATIIPISQIEEPYHVELPEEGIDEMLDGATLGQYSNKLARLVKSTGFRRSKRTVQLERVGPLIEAAAEIAKYMRECTVMLSAEDSCQAYVPRLTPEGITHTVVDLQKLVISGICLGLSAPYRERLTTRAIRRDSDLVNRDGGLLLTIELDEASDASKYPELRPGSIIHIPVSNPHLELLLEPSETVYETMEGEGGYE